jgi:hypothetical protein
MFFIRFEDGSVATELDFGDWDHVPRDRRVKSVGLILPVPDETHLITWEPLPAGCERYYCARLGTAPLGGVDAWIGYTLIGVMDGRYIEIQATHRGLGPPKIGRAGDLNIREEAWRSGI